MSRRDACPLPPPWVTSITYPLLKALLKSVLYYRRARTSRSSSWPSKSSTYCLFLHWTPKGYLHLPTGHTRLIFCCLYNPQLPVQPSAASPLYSYEADWWLWIFYKVKYVHRASLQNYRHLIFKHHVEISLRHPCAQIFITFAIG